MKSKCILGAVACLVGLAFGSSIAQTDRPKALVGKWEGEFQSEETSQRAKGRTISRDSSQYERTLVIKEVREQEGKWVVRNAQYGVTGKQLGRVDVTLEVTGDDVTLAFTNHANNPVKLHLTKQGVLIGTMEVKSPVGSAFRQLELKKVE